MAQRFYGERPPAADPVFDQVAEMATGSYNQLQQVDELLQKGDLQKAASLSQEILRRDPDNMGSLLNLLFMARFLNRLDDMVDAWYARAVRINPEVPYIYNHYGAVLLRQGKYDAAIVALRKAIALRPGLLGGSLVAWEGRWNSSTIRRKPSSSIGWRWRPTRRIAGPKLNWDGSSSTCAGIAKPSRGCCRL